MYSYLCLFYLLLTSHIGVAVAQRNEQVILSRFDPRLLQSVSPCILGQDTEP